MRITKFSPIARAVGVMGATAALVTGVTFANLTSNAVAISPNTITTAGASLTISAGIKNVVTGACAGTGTTTPGITAHSLAPGSSTNIVPFCLGNTGDVNMSITASITPNLSASVAAQSTTLTVTCGDALVGTLSTWGPATFTTNIAAHTAENCTAQATLSSSYSGTASEVIPSFDVNFVGTQV
jgi:hypothetical protein